MILITSAAGGVGLHLVRELAARKQRVRAFVKDDRQAELVRKAGASEVVVGDLRKPGDLEAAMQGARQIYHAAPTQIIDEIPIAKRLIDTAATSGLEHLLFHSVIHPDIAELTHHHQKLMVEQMLQKSKLPFTVLRPSHYMQNYLDFWELLRGGLLAYPFSPDIVMGVVDVADVAEAALNVLVAPDAHIGKIYDLSSQVLNRHEMARIWSQTLGHPVRAIRLSPNAVNNPLSGVGVLGSAFRAFVTGGLRAAPHLVRGLLQAPNARGIRSWPADAHDAYLKMLSYYDVHGLPPGNMAHLPKLLGHPPTSYTDFTRREARVRGVAVHGALGPGL